MLNEYISESSRFGTSPLILLLNGPAGSGKDTIANAMSSFNHAKFATPLYECLRSLFRISPNDWLDIYTNHKNEPTEKLGGMSPRQAMIWMSEDVCKPKLGSPFFGEMLAKRIEAVVAAGRNGDRFVVSDSGFTEEAMVLVETYGAESVKLVNLHRYGHDYKNDSRNYINGIDLGVDTAHVSNVGSVETVTQLILDWCFTGLEIQQ